MLGDPLARRANRRGLRSCRGRPMDAAVGSAVPRRHRTRSRGSRIRVDGAAYAPAGSLSCGRQRRSRASSASHHRRQERSNPRALHYPARNWAPAPEARDAEFGEPQSSGVGSPLGPGFAGPPAAAAMAKSTYGGPANVHIPAAVSPYGVGETRGGIKARLKSAPTERKPIINPPLPPPAPRETAKVDGSGSMAARPSENNDSEQKRIDSHSIEIGEGPPASASTTQGSSTEADDKAKVGFVPPALFQ